MKKNLFAVVKATPLQRVDEDDKNHAEALCEGGLLWRNFARASYTILCFLALNFNNIYCYIYPINLFRPYDILLLPPIHKDELLQVSVGFEASTKVVGFQEVCEGQKIFTKKVNPLQIWQTTQDALAALKGFNVESSAGQLSQLFNIDDDNQTHGLFCPSANFKVNANLMFALRYYFPHGLILGLFLPYYEMELSKVNFCEEVKDPTFEAQIPQSQKLLAEVAQIGCLSFDGWKRKGLGDLTLQAMWLGNYPQAKPWLKNVRLNAQLGIIFPTGKQQDINKLLAIPFGNDGSWGFMFGLGIDLRFLNHFRVGANADFMPLFGNTKCRRIKVDRSQTDLFFVNRAKTFKDWGLTNYFQLYAEVSTYSKLFAFEIAYEFVQHNRDKLFPSTDKFNPIIANSAESLQEFTNNSLIFFLNFDAQKEYYHTRPFLTAFYKLGFDGKRSLLADTFGFMFTLNF